MAKKRLRVAVLQMVSTDSLEDNLQEAQKLIAEAASRGCELVALPENFALFGVKDIHELAENEKQHGPILRFLHTCSLKYQVWIVGGTAPFNTNTQGDVAPQNKVYAGSSVWNAKGHQVGRYDKVHLFDVDVADGVGRYRESDHYAPGKKPEVVNTPWGVLGLSVCYDLRFPEHFRHLAQQQATLVSVPSAFTFQTGEAHWEVLLRARAIENQCFVLAPNQGGHHPGNRVTWGHSCIIDPWGEVLAMSRDSGSAVISADLKLTDLIAIREKMPVLKHSKLLSSG